MHVSMHVVFYPCSDGGSDSYSLEPFCGSIKESIKVTLQEAASLLCKVNLMNFSWDFWLHIDKPKVVSRSQKSKTDDLVFIKIAMSNHPPPPPRESFKEAR